jgi:2-polyprenyl-3-methyl-5-hydroxy-6-metoxy-1,4-benzoquinol methylase
MFLCEMTKLIHYNNCPVCNSNNIVAVLKAKDNTVSNKIFEIWECGNCTLRFTQDVPAEDAIGDYYKSPEYISHSNTNKGFINKLYHAVRSVTLNSKKNLVEKVSGKKKGNLLDIGAGTGAFASTMKKNGWNVTALEPDETARANAKKEFNIDLLALENLFAFEKKSFDVITLWHVLEHVHQLHTYLNTFFSLLKDGGHLIIAVPNYTSYDAREYESAWAAYDVPRHLYHFSPKSVHLLLAKHNFNPKKMKPMWFDSYYISLLSEKYITGKNNPFKAFISGTISNVQTLKNKQKSSSVIYIAQK